MLVTMLVTTPYAADGITPKQLEAGTTHDLPENIALGFIAEKLGRRDSAPVAAPETAAASAAPETGAPVEVAAQPPAEGEDGATETEGEGDNVGNADAIPADDNPKPARRKKGAGRADN